MQNIPYILNQRPVTIKIELFKRKKIKSSNVNLVNSRFVFLIHVHEFEALLESNFFSQK